LCATPVALQPVPLCFVHNYVHREKWAHGYEYYYDGLLWYHIVPTHDHIVELVCCTYLVRIVGEIVYGTMALRTYLGLDYGTSLHRYVRMVNTATLFLNFQKNLTGCDDAI
jgi:hypothetical protein